MSKAGKAKGADRAGKTVSAPTPAATQDIIPGKFTDQDWNCMVNVDETDDFVGEVMEELVGRVMDDVTSRYLERQLLPFTITMAKDAMLQIVEWQFLARDEGEQDCETDAAWAEDDEPEPCLTDCWAQGSVPREVLPPQTIPEEVEETEDNARSLATIAESSADPASMQGTAESSQGALETPPESAEAEAEPQQEPLIPEGKHMKAIPRPPLSGPGQTRRRIKFRPKKGRLEYSSLDSLTESMSQMEYRIDQERRAVQDAEDRGTPDHPLLSMPASVSSMLRSQVGRPPGQRELKYDERGNVLSVIKITPDNLPSHSVKTRFKIIEVEDEAARSHVEAMRRGKHVPGRRKPPHPQTAATARTKTSTLTSSLVSGSRYYQEDARHAQGSLPPPLMDNLDIVAGVTVREGDRVRKGPRPPRRVDTQPTPPKMRQVREHAEKTALMVAQILDRTTPTIRPLGESPIVPPIGDKSKGSPGAAHIIAH